MVTVAGVVNSAPEWISPESPHEAGEGHVRLSWSDPGADGAGGQARFVLEQAGGADFAGARTRYEGVDTASFLSGLPAGMHYFRVGVVGGSGRVGEWSAPMVVTVRYPAMARVWVLMGTGLVCLVVLLTVVLGGHLRTRRESGGGGD